MRLGAIAALIAVVAIGCAVTGAPPDFSVDFPGGEWGAHQVLVYDGTGLVTGARPGPRDPARADDVIAIPDRREIDVGWTGGACSHRPTLTVSGNAQALRLAVTNPSDPQPLPILPVSCPAVGIPLRVTLSLSQAVPQDAIGIEVSY